MQINPAVEQNKNIKWSEGPWNQSDVCLWKPYSTILLSRPQTAGNVIDHIYRQVIDAVCRASFRPILNSQLKEKRSGQQSY